MRTASHSPPHSTCSKDIPDQRWRTANRLVLLATILLGIIYVSGAWSPSSYGHVLVNYLDQTENGPDFGSPQPVRGDEWSVITPLVQATVNNEFARINETSLYREDLRSNYGLPIHDWGLAFKPTMWLYGPVNPAYAYSAHWFALAALFLIGYAWLFRWLGATPIVAFALSGSLYFTSHVQFWWNSKGPELALFPWMILPFATRLPFPIRVALFYWAAVSWLVTNFYPPVQIPLAFVGMLLIAVRQPSLLLSSRVVAIAVAALLAVATVATYLGDYLSQIAATSYPGARRLNGGELPWWYLRTWLWPTADGHQPLLAHSSPELGAPGLYFTLLAYVFLDYSRWRNLWLDIRIRTSLAILLGGLLAMLAWMVLPLPSWLGALLLWNFVQGSRMLFAFGVLHVCLLIVLASALGFKPTWLRFSIFVAAIAIPLLLWNQLGNRSHALHDYLILIFVLPAFLYSRRRPRTACASLTLASLAGGVALFGGINPLQSAWPIFNRQPTPTTQSLDRLAKSQEGVLAVAGLPGAIANGLGFRSVSHVLPAPRLPFWQERFPTLSAADLDSIFNRYAHVVPTDDDSPRLMKEDVVGVPMRSFVRPGSQSAPVRYISEPPPSSEPGGHIDSQRRDGKALVLWGWAPWQGPPDTHEIEVLMRTGSATPPFRTIFFRPDVWTATRHGVHATNGFLLVIPTTEDANRKESTLQLPCIYAFDPVTGKRSVLRAPTEASSCK